ncbi:uncharacterized protein METZ01_LOCUS473440, partial [marine metagenome]
GYLPCRCIDQHAPVGNRPQEEGQEEEPQGRARHQDGSPEKGAHEHPHEASRHDDGQHHLLQRRPDPLEIFAPAPARGRAPGGHRLRQEPRLQAQDEHLRLSRARPQGPQGRHALPALRRQAHRRHLHQARGHPSRNRGEKPRSRRQDQLHQLRPGNPLPQAAGQAERRHLPRHEPWRWGRWREEGPQGPV